MEAVMTRERPHLDREKVLSEECARRRVCNLGQQVLPLLTKKEGVGTPYRAGTEIRIPIIRGDDRSA